MRARVGITLSALGLMLGAFAACGTDYGEGPSSDAADAGNDVTAEAASSSSSGSDAADEDVIVEAPDASEAGIDAGTDAGQDAGQDAGHDAGQDAGEDAGTCPDLSGGYAVTGSCTGDSFYLPSTLCVKQSACAVKITSMLWSSEWLGTVSKGGAFSLSGAEPAEPCSATAVDGQLASAKCTQSPTNTCTWATTRVPLKNATRACCDVALQDCANGERCTLVGTAAKFAIPACIPDTGSKPLNASCTRASAQTEDIGNDNCAKGFYCANLGQADPSNRLCNKLCSNQPDCASDQICYGLGMVGGVCRPRCDLISGARAECGAGTKCSPIATLPPAGEKHLRLDTACDAIGTQAVGQACSGPSDCGVGLACSYDAHVCAPLCDDTHACVKGTCVAFASIGPVGSGISASTGYCK